MPWIMARTGRSTAPGGTTRSSVGAWSWWGPPDARPRGPRRLPGSFLVHAYAAMPPALSRGARTEKVPFVNRT